MRNTFFLIYLLTFMTACQGGVMTKEEEEARVARQIKCQDVVENYIKDHAQYPETYEPLEFSDYGEMWGERNGVKVPDDEDYFIFHKHKLKNLNGEIQLFSGYFYVTFDYFVDIIEVEKTMTVNTWPPKTEVWTSQFGRPLNANDSLEILGRTEKINHKSLRDLKEDFEKGNTEGVTPEHKKLLKQILDTIH